MDCARSRTVRPDQLSLRWRFWPHHPRGQSGNGESSRGRLVGLRRERNYSREGPASIVVGTTQPARLGEISLTWQGVRRMRDCRSSSEGVQGRPFSPAWPGFLCYTFDTSPPAAGRFIVPPLFPANNRTTINFVRDDESDFWMGAGGRRLHFHVREELVGRKPRIKNDEDL